MDSGILTAVGAVIETKWRKVPRTGDQIGITNTNPHRFMRVEPDGGIPWTMDTLEPYNEVDGSIELGRTIKQAMDYEGGRFSFKVDSENLYYPLLSVLGRDVQTQLSGSGTTSGLTASYSHAMNPYRNAPSLTVEEIYGALADRGRLTSGFIGTGLNLTFGRTLMAEWIGYGFRQIPNTYFDATGLDASYNFTNVDAALPPQMQDGTAGVNLKISTTPNYIDVVPPGVGDGPFTFARMFYGSQSAPFATNFVAADATVGGTGFAAVSTGVEIMEGHTINLSRDFESHHVSGSGYDPGDCAGQKVHVGGNMTIVFTDNVFPIDVIARAKFGINFKHMGVLIGTSGQRYSLEVWMPRVRFSAAPIANPSGGMTIAGRYVAEKDPSLGYSVLFTLVNTVSNALLSGKVADLPGGLGGFAAS